MSQHSLWRSPWPAIISYTHAMAASRTARQMRLVEMQGHHHHPHPNRQRQGRWTFNILYAKLHPRRSDIGKVHVNTTVQFHNIETDSDSEILLIKFYSYTDVLRAPSHAPKVMGGRGNISLGHLLSILYIMI